MPLCSRCFCLSLHCLRKWLMVFHNLSSLQNQLLEQWLVYNDLHLDCQKAFRSTQTYQILSQKILLSHQLPENQTLKEHFLRLLGFAESHLALVLHSVSYRHCSLQRQEHSLCCWELFWLSIVT